VSDVRGSHLTVALLLATGLAQGAEVPRFTDVTGEAGIDYRNVCGAPPGSKGWLTESMGAGAAWLDYDGDSVLDLYLVNGSAYDREPGKGEPNRLYRGLGEGKFEEVTDKAGVGHRGWGYGVAVGDVDNDGDPDLYVTNYGPNVLYLNDGDGTFTDATERAGVGDVRWSTAAAFFDLEGDGDLDLYVGNYMVGDPSRVPRRGAKNANSKYCGYRGIPVACGPLGQVPEQDALYRNEGDGRFKDVTREAGLLLDRPRYTLGVVTGDVDNDGRQDVYVANDSVQNSLWKNRGDGKLVDVGISSLSALNADGRAHTGMGTYLRDVDGDGWLDVVVTNFSYDLNTLYRNMSGKMFLDDSARIGLGVTNMALSWGAGFHDFDLDGDLDLMIANGHVYPQVDDYDIGTLYRQRNHLFVNDGKRLVESSAEAGPGFAIERSFRGAAFADYDQDGDVDVLVTAMDELALLLRNDGPGSGSFLEIDLEGTRSNRDGVGARVVVTVGERRIIRERKGGGSYLSASSPTLHFGLGKDVKRVSKVEVRWPSGITDTLTGLAVDRRIEIREGQTAAD
jgi:hypothetical protein